MMPFHSLLLVGLEARCSSHANLHSAARTDGQPAYGDALASLLPISDEAQDTVDRLIVAKPVCEKLRYPNNVDDVAHISLASSQWEHWNTSSGNFDKHLVARIKIRSAASRTVHIQDLDGALA